MLYITGISFIVIGLIFKLFPPKKINSIYGHRTGFSMKNQDTWDEAQRFSAKSFIVLGFIDVVMGLLLNQLFADSSMVYEFGFFIAGSMMMLLVDERHLRKVFNRDGSRKHQRIL